jgi:hypothetical protein
MTDNKYKTGKIYTIRNKNDHNLTGSRRQVRFSFEIDLTWPEKVISGQTGQVSSGQKNLYLPVVRSGQIQVRSKNRGRIFFRPKTPKKRPKTPQNAPKRPKNARFGRFLGGLGVRFIKKMWCLFSGQVRSDGDLKMSHRCLRSDSGLVEYLTWSVGQVLQVRSISPVVGTL